MLAGGWNRRTQSPSTGIASPIAIAAVSSKQFYREAAATCQDTLNVYLHAASR
jgi:hypothetical protein